MNRQTGTKLKSQKNIKDKKGRMKESKGAHDTKREVGKEGGRKEEKKAKM